eukprot:3687631-Amphidinium_carterae.1
MDLNEQHARNKTPKLWQTKHSVETLNPFCFFATVCLTSCAHHHVPLRLLTRKRLQSNDAKVTSK